MENLDTQSEMPQASPQADPRAPASPSDLPPTIVTAPAGLRSLAARYPWLPYVLPLVVFLVVTSLEPAPPDPTNQTIESTGWFGFTLPYGTYPLLYTAKIVLVIVAMVFAMPVYRQFPLRVSPLSVVVGVVGVVAWIGLCRLGIEQRLLPKLGLENFIESGQRSGFNPLVELAGNPLAAYGFLAIRFVGLVLVVPVIEEFFLRGFLMRFCVHELFWNVPFGTVNLAAVLAGTLVPMAMHPAELVAAGVWFSLVTVLMVRTRNIWDCVVAHAVTNLLLGIYVVGFNQWQLM